MSSTKQAVITYAKALFQTLKGNVVLEVPDEELNIGNITALDRTNFADPFFVGEELLLIRTALLASDGLRQCFRNPLYSDQQRLELLLTIFPGVTIPLKSLLKVISEKSDLHLLPQISDAYTKMLLRFRNSTTVKIFTASGLKENSGLLLLNGLRKITNSKDIVLKAFYNPQLLGGLVLEYNSKSIDASILKEFSLFFNEV
jgi:F0F1-type ATP synthase delta subunit